jgi:alkanesulfonate monooxygenase SsuD/methylene tetrahydromethanopterin reductase-like flavin-dependent oxidoreductase (luciferase family)
MLAVIDAGFGRSVGIDACGAMSTSETSLLDWAPPPAIHNRIRFLHFGNMLNAPFAGHSTSADGFRTHLIGTPDQIARRIAAYRKRGVDLILGGLPARPGVCGMLRHAGVAHSA